MATPSPAPPPDPALPPLPVGSRPRAVLITWGVFVVLVAVTVGFVVLVAVPAWQGHPHDELVEAESFRLTTPERSGDLTLIEDSASLARSRSQVARLESAMGGQVDVVYAEYELDGGYATFIGLTDHGLMIAEEPDTPGEVLAALTRDLRDAATLR